jgi:hypothetical protein
MTARFSRIFDKIAILSSARKLSVQIGAKPIIHDQDGLARRNDVGWASAQHCGAL